jgi:ring-1,2-phenylacetyl-CoA epoxidase subunit PaaE
MAKPRFYDLIISDVRKDTSSSVEISFEIPKLLSTIFAFVPGQYLTLRADVGGVDVRRSYSICSAVGSDTLSVGVKRIEGGAFSSFALALKIGDVLSVMPPQGRFTAPIGGRHNYLLLAAGSGVTPIKSIAQSVLGGEPESTITLCYANRNTDSVMFRQAFDDLKDKYLTRFLMTHIMDEEAQDVALFNGRMDAEKLNTMSIRGLITPLDYDAIYICGPQPMIEAASAALHVLGVPVDRIKCELFSPSSPLPIAGSIPVVIPTEGSLIEVVLDGGRRKFRMVAGQMLLDAATQSGLELPYSCANGMCATCRCKLAEGQGTMVQNFSLEPWEMKRGFVLACQFQPESDHVVLDFDAV